MSLLDYANMLTAHEAKVEITVWKDAPIGKKYEHKNEIVEFAYEIGKETESRERALEALKPFEVDGWKGNVDHIFTQRRYKNIGYVVSFKRYVDVEDANAQ